MSSTVSQPNRLETQRHDRTSPPQAAVDQPPRVRRITVAVAALLAAVSATGLVWGSGLYGSSAPSTLVSRGGDAANLVVVVPALLVASWFAQRGSMTGSPRTRSTSLLKGPLEDGWQDKVEAFAARIPLALETSGG